MLVEAHQRNFRTKKISAINLTTATTVIVDFVSASVKTVWGVEGKDAELPCDVTPPTHTDAVTMVFWFKDDTGMPLYTYVPFFLNFMYAL